MVSQEWNLIWSIAIRAVFSLLRASKENLLAFTGGIYNWEKRHSIFERDKRPAKIILEPCQNRQWFATMRQGGILFSIPNMTMLVFLSFKVSEKPWLSYEESSRIIIASLELLRQAEIRSISFSSALFFENKNVALDWNFSSIFFLDKKITLAMALGTRGKDTALIKRYSYLIDIYIYTQTAISSSSNIQTQMCHGQVTLLSTFYTHCQQSF